MYFKLQPFLLFLLLAISNATSVTKSQDFFNSETSPYYSFLKYIYLISFIPLAYKINRLTNSNKSVVYGILFVALASVLSDIFSPIPKIPISEILVYGLIAVVFLTSLKNPHYSNNLIIALALFLLISLLSATIFPAKYLEYGYDGIVNFRYYGLSGHANSIGALSAFLLLVLTQYPNRMAVVIRYIFIIVAAISLFISQSKTAIFIFSLGCIYHIIRYILIVIPHRSRKLFSYFIFVTILIISYMIFPILMDIFNNDPNINSLTGRDKVWNFTLEVWRENKLTGYGYSSLWNQSMQNDFNNIYGWKPGYAHSLYFQILGGTGFIGIIAYIFLFSHILIFAKENLRMIFLLFITIRGISEVTFGVEYFSENFIISAMCISLIASRASEKSRGE